MKNIIIAFFLLFSIVSYSKILYPTNGETIYRTGKNLKDEKLLNKDASRIKFVTNCQSCHGKNGDRINPSIKFSSLSNPGNFPIPYTDTLFYRFLDKDLKSNGKKANIGVIWKMNDKDKKDLLEFLKAL